MENGWSWAHLTSVGGVDTNNWWPMLWNATLLHVIVRYLQNWMEFPLDPSPPCGHTGASLMFVCFFGQSSNWILVGSGFGDIWSLGNCKCQLFLTLYLPFGRGDQGMFGWLALATKCTRIWTMPARCLGSRTLPAPKVLEVIIKGYHFQGLSLMDILDHYNGI